MFEYLTLVGPDGNGIAGRIWKFFTEDALTVVDTSGYFNNASDLLQVGDEINVCVIADLTADPLVISDAGKVIVVSNANGVVDTSNETAFVITDAD